MKRFNDGRDWFFEKRFGLFIHWGIYSVNGWQEQELYRMNRMGYSVSRESYRKLVKSFNPSKFDPDTWIDIAEDAGMGYICFTLKHVDGFCMWDTAQTDFKITSTPYRADVFAMLAEACEKRRFPLCVYYSVPDMFCRYYPNSGKPYEYARPFPGDEPDVSKYLQFVRAQVREICSNYGKISGFWWDANRLNIKDESLNELIREMQPDAVINKRGFGEGDFSTPERDCIEGKEPVVYTEPVEYCNSIGEQSWGFRENEDYFSPGFLTMSIDNALARGANYLLNVGPRPDGTFPCEALRILKSVGSWMRRVGESFYRAEPLPGFFDNGNILFTAKNDTVYVHVGRCTSSGITLKPLEILPERAVVLNTGEKLSAEVVLMPWASLNDGRKYLHVRGLPENMPGGEAVILKLDFKKNAFPSV